MANTIPKNIIYKKTGYLTTDGPDGTSKKTLQQMLETALSTHDKAKDRREDLDETGKNHRILNSFRTQGGMLFGNLFVYSDDTNQQIVEIDPDAAELPVEQIAPPLGKSGKRREFLQSILYFGIKGNHTVVMQSAALRAASLEAYLNWFLGSHTTELGEMGLILQDNPTFKSKSFKKNPAKAVIIGSHVLDSKIMEEAQKQPKGQTQIKTLDVTLPSMAISALGDIMKKYNAGSKELADVFNEGDLRVYLKFAYKRKTGVKTEAFLNTIATSMRNIEGSEYSIQMKDGSTIKGTSIKLANKITVGVSNGLAIQGDVYTEMHNWLSHLISSGTVDP